MSQPKYFLYARKSTDEDDRLPAPPRQAGQILPDPSLAEGSIESQLIGTPPNLRRRTFGIPPIS